MLNILQWRRKGPFTEAANTAIVALLEPGTIRGRLIITRLAIKTLATAHVLTVMQVLGKFLTASDAAAGQKVVNMVAGHGFAANDILAIKMPNGKYEKYTVASVATDAVTLVENLSALVPAKSVVCFFGVPADGHEQVTLLANTENEFESSEGYFGANEFAEPMILHVNNVTNASVIQAVNCPIISV